MGNRKWGWGKGTHVAIGDGSGRRETLGDEMREVPLRVKKRSKNAAKRSRTRFSEPCNV